MKSSYFFLLMMASGKTATLIGKIWQYCSAERGETLEGVSQQMCPKFVATVAWGKTNQQLSFIYFSLQQDATGKITKQGNLVPLQQPV